MAGGLIILGVGLMIVMLWLGRAIPGLFGEWLSLLAGLASTPFLMEASFIVVGLMIVLGLNGWRQRREGDEFVYLEQVEGPDAAELPDSARWAIYRSEPLAGVEPGELEAIEGALEIGDLEQAALELGRLDIDRLGSPEVMRLRIRLAEASGETALAARLRARTAPH